MTSLPRCFQFQEFAQDEEDSAALDDTTLKDASAILQNFFGADGFSASMRWSAEDTSEQKPSGEDAVALAAEEEGDMDFPDEK
jgi:hypothetical protein